MHVQAPYVVANYYVAVAIGLRFESPPRVYNFSFAIYFLSLTNGTHLTKDGSLGVPLKLKGLFAKVTACSNHT